MADNHDEAGVIHDNNGPPALPFSLRDHKLSIVIFWTLIATEICFIPISFYYGLWFGSSLNHGALFAIITSVFGFVSGFEYSVRAFQLARPDPKYRPPGSQRWQFDGTQRALAVPFTVSTAVLIGFNIPYEPIVRGLALPLALADIILGALFAGTALAHGRGWRTPMRLSSTASGRPCPPFALVVLEDVVAVDGGCPEFRAAVQRRWDASPRFRELLVRLSWLWGVSGVLVGGAVLAVVFSVDEVVGYGVGWGVPSLHAALGTVVTFRWARSALDEERRTWSSVEAEGLADDTEAKH